MKNVMVSKLLGGYPFKDLSSEPDFSGYCFLKVAVGFI